MRMPYIRRRAGYGRNGSGRYMTRRCACRTTAAGRGTAVTGLGDARVPYHRRGAGYGRYRTLGDARVPYHRRGAGYGFRSRDSYGHLPRRPSSM